VIADNENDLVVVTPVTGDTRFRGDFIVGGNEVGSPGPRAMTVRSLDSEASLHVISGGNGNAELTLAAPSNLDAILTLSEGNNHFHILNSGSVDKLMIHDESNELFGVNRISGDTYIRGQLKLGNDPLNPMFVAESLTGEVMMQGDLTIGGQNILGERSMTIKSADSKASLDIIAGPAADATMLVHSGSGHASTLSLIEGFNSFHLQNQPSTNTFDVNDGQYQLLSVNRNSGNTYLRGQLSVGHDSAHPAFLSNINGDTHMKGDLLVGGSLVSGPRSAIVQSNDNVASMSVISGHASNADITITAPVQGASKITLTEGVNSFNIIHEGTSQNLVIDNTVNPLLTIDRDTGNTNIRGELRVGVDPAKPVFSVQGTDGTGYVTMSGDLTVGGNNTLGERTATISSTDGPSSMNVISGGSSNAGVVISSPDGAESWLTLSHKAGSSFHLVNDGALDHLYIADDNNKLITIQPISGDTKIRGNLDIGKTLEVRRDVIVGGTKESHTVSVQSFDGAADVLVASGGMSDATLTLKTPLAQTASLSFIEVNGTEFHILNRGANDTLVITDGKKDLVKVYPESGNMYVRGELEIGNVTTIRGNLTVYGDIYSHCDGFRWEQGSKHCYKHFPTPASFANARNVCMKWKGELVSITSQAENDFVVGAVAWDTNVNSVWIGYSDAQGSQMEFEWLTGEIAVTGDQEIYENWSPNNPSDEYGQKDCAVMGSGGLWSDISCVAAQSFVCERKI